MRSPNERHIDAALSNISVAYQNALTAYIAMLILPIVSVSKRSNKYFVFDKGNMSRSDSRRQDKTESNRVTYELSNDSYYCESYALHDIVTDDDRNNSDLGEPEANSTEFLTGKILLDYEYDVASQLTSTANLTQNTTLVGTAQFNDYTNSDPKTVVKTAKSTIYTATGQKANTMVVPYDVALTLANHPHVLDVLKYTDDKILTRSGLPPVLWGLNILEAGASQNTSKKGQTDSLSAIWGKNIIIAHIAPNPGMRTVSLGYTFAWKKQSDPVLKVSKWAEPKLGEGAIAIEPEMKVDNKIVAAGAGYLVKNAIA